jgi:transposase
VGSESKGFCQGGTVPSGVQPWTTGCSSMRCCIVRAGIPWRDLPERFGDFRVVPTRFSRWAARGVWEKVFQHLAKDADNEYAMIDSTIVRAHQHSAGARKKGAKNKPSAEARAG